jgi:hypothetical protein
MFRETRCLWTNLSQYSTRDVFKSLYALARLQAAVALYSEEQQQLDEVKSRGELADGERLTGAIDKALLDDLAYYSVFANAAYGWKMDLAWNRRLRFGDLETIISHTNLSPEDIVAQEWISKTHRPRYFIARDRVKKTIVLCVRGTWSAHDVLTDLCCLPDEVPVEFVRKGFLFNSKESVIIRAHHGMLKAALLMRDAVQDTILRELNENPGYSLVLVGHSMGGGVCALLRLLLDDWVTASTSVYIYGAPCAISAANWAVTRDANIVSVIMDGDPFARLSFGHVFDIGSAVSSLCDDPALRSSIIAACRGDLSKMSRESRLWCLETLSGLRLSMDHAKLVPPGRILRLSISGSRKSQTLTIREEDPEHYQSLQLRPGMFDLQHHVPSRYIWSLRQLATQAA